MPSSPNPVGDVSIIMGGVFASREPAVVKTILGSCISACLFDPGTGIGGMNHFMLPGNKDAVASGVDDARFGVHAMDDLIGLMMRQGADRRRMVAKVFGGAHVLDTLDSESSVPRKNVRFILRFLADEGFRLAAHDLGGADARQLHFSTGTGMARVKRVISSRVKGRLLTQEQAHVERPPAFGSVELFG